MFLMNLLLAAVWAALQDGFSPRSLGVGFLLGYGLLWLLGRRGVINSQRYVSRIPQLIALLGVFLSELIRANFRLFIEVLTPGYSMTPGFVSLPLDANSDTEISILAIMISLTPGTLSMDLSPDRRSLLIHAMYLRDEEELKASIKRNFEQRLLQVMR